MITDLWIENFKGIGQRQHIPLSPITLLFGANSAGKSTVLHALLYLREILLNQSFDPKHPLDGENTISLGGFDQFVGVIGNYQGGRSRVSIKVRFRAHEDQVREFLERLDRAFYGRRPSSEVDRNFAPAGSDNLMEYWAGYSGSWTVPIDIEFVIGLANEEEAEYPHATYRGEPERKRWLKRIIISVGGDRFLDAKLVFDDLDMFDEQFEGYVNLLHPVWPIGPRLTDDYKLSKAELRSGLDEVSPDIFIGGDEMPMYTMYDSILVIGVLETVEYFNLPSRRYQQLFKDGKHELSSFQLQSLSSYLEDICPASQRQRYQKQISNWEGDNDWRCEVIVQKFKQLGADDQSIVAELPQRLLGIVFTETRGGPPNIGVVNLIRELAFHDLAGMDGERTGYDCPLVFDGYNSIFPSEDPVLIRRERSTDAHRGPAVLEKNRISATETVSRAVKGSLTWLSEQLQNLTYIGPKRSNVPRELSTKNFENVKNWGNGLAAWRWLLETDDPRNVDVCSEWLASKERGLGTGYTITVRGYRQLIDFADEIPVQGEGRYTQTREESDEIQEKRSDALWRLESAYRQATPFRTLLLSNGPGVSRHPQEVGEGITQVVPVIVAFVKAALDNSIVAIEQPELHLHPSLAARLGDMFVSTMFNNKDMAYRNGAQCLIETHSEHLILRILRRIRQTTDGELPEHIPPVKPDDVCVLWVDNLGDGTTFKRLRIDGRGEFIDRWPQGFFREREEDLFG